MISGHVIARCRSLVPYSPLYHTISRDSDSVASTLSRSVVVTADGSADAAAVAVALVLIV